jgi:hypothetical protein
MSDKPWKVLPVSNTADNEACARRLEEALNEMDAAGYEPLLDRVIRNGHHLLLPGQHRRHPLDPTSEPAE